MDHRQILQARKNRKTRLARPFENFLESFDQCEKAGEALLKGAFDPEFVPLLERSIVISAVTAIEVYYRDMLDGIFKYCSPEFFEPKLKYLHAEKYDIVELLNVYRHGIHPLELVSQNQSFQNTDQIERVFSKFLGKGFWDSVLNLQVRLKEKPEDIITWSNDDLEGLKATFTLRHELIHNPARAAFLTQRVLDNLNNSFNIVFGSDLLLAKVMTDNQDPTLKDEIAS